MRRPREDVFPRDTFRVAFLVRCGDARTVRFRANGFQRGTHALRTRDICISAPTVIGHQPVVPRSRPSVKPLLSSPANTPNGVLASVPQPQVLPERDAAWRRRLSASSVGRANEGGRWI